METVLKAQIRDDRGKGAARKLRAQGLVPGVLYGQGFESQAITLSSRDLIHYFHAMQGAAAVVDIEIDGTRHMAIPREIQKDHLRGRYIHIDFLAVRRDQKVKMTVEIHEIGEAPGIKTGGVIEHHLREVDIECLPGDVPEQLVADVSGLELGDMLRVGDIPAPEGVTVMTDPETPVISVVTPAVLRTEADLGLPGEEAAEEEAPVLDEEAPADEGEAPAADDEA
jgi:large subunit ribosomal protein L25